MLSGCAGCHPSLVGDWAPATPPLQELGWACLWLKGDLLLFWLEG